MAPRGAPAGLTVGVNTASLTGYPLEQALRRSRDFLADALHRVS